RPAYTKKKGTVVLTLKVPSPLLVSTLRLEVVPTTRSVLSLLLKVPAATEVRVPPTCELMALPKPPLPSPSRTLTVPLRLAGAGGDVQLPVAQEIAHGHAHRSGADREGFRSREGAVAITQHHAHGAVGVGGHDVLQAVAQEVAHGHRVGGAADGQRDRVLQV